MARLGGHLANILSVGIPLFLRYAFLQAYRALLCRTLRALTNPETGPTGANGTNPERNGVVEYYF